MVPLDIPGMALAASATTAAVDRAAPNVWWVRIAGGPAAHANDLRPDAFALPSAIVAHDAVAAKIELDTCGAWATVANRLPPRPIVVRRAGWVDLRGHPSGTIADDRVGLGPGDTLVLWDGDVTAQNDVFRSALSGAGRNASALASVVAAVDGVSEIVTIGVPGELGSDPLQRVADATGLDRSELELPGYPLGDIQPDLWQQPPTPPRMARLTLRPELGSVADVRNLLDRLLASWRLDGRVDKEDVKLVASELATNAILHTGLPETVSVHYLGDRVLIAVADRSRRGAELAPLVAPAETTSGRGLHIVDALTSDWGVDTEKDGKRVWCEMRLSSA